MIAHRTSTPPPKLRRHRGRPVKIPLTGGGHTVVDKADACLLQGRRCHRAGGIPGDQYARVHLRGRRLEYVHRLILPTLPGFQVDHIDGNRLNNRRSNLRPCTPSQNRSNSPGCKARQSRFKGVFRAGAGWRVRCRKHARRFDFGVFRSEIVAGCVADDAAAMLHGQFAWFNFPLNLPRNFLRRFLSQSKGRIMSVTFYKRRTACLRTMRCRVGVTCDVRGGELAFDPADKGLLPVYDMAKRAYRFIPVEGVLCLTYRGKRYRVTPDPRAFPAC